VHGDLHPGNVLASTRGARVAVDPKGLVAEPAFDVLPSLRNRWDDLTRTGATRRALERRLAIVTEAATIDRDRARRWAQARAVEDLLWRREHDDGTPPEVTTALAEWLAD
jgi:streptomycin 6-kinase